MPELITIKSPPLISKPATLQVEVETVQVPENGAAWHDP